ncbi:MAG: 6-bladed beta-propeller [Paramuribaculum sp.]|nr:6-bladed beta-propeller [Paramuribaculum sp.]
MTLKSKVILPAIGALAILSTGCGKGTDGGNVVTIDLASAVEGESVNHLKVTDVVYTPLDTAAAAMFSERGNIVGLAGDTVIIHDRNDSEDRLILFTLADGKMVGQINHMGSGPGEYRWIETVYLDRPAHQVVINTVDNIAHRYTLADEYVDSRKYDTKSTKRFSIGSLENGINMYEEVDGGFVIHQLDRNFNEVDSIKVDGYQLGYYSGMFERAGNQSVITMGDTVYSITPGKLEKFTIIDRKGKTITPEIEVEITNLARSGDYKGSSDKQNSYISPLIMLIGNDCMFLLSLYNKSYSYDVFRLSDGALMTHLPFSWDEAASAGIEVEYSGAKMHAVPRFTQDGRWYAIISEEQAVGPNGEPNDGELNAAIVSFKLEE